MLDGETSNESEALVEALQFSATFFAVQELRAIPDLSRRRPRLMKEAVKGQVAPMSLVAQASCTDEVDQW